MRGTLPEYRTAGAEPNLPQRSPCDNAPVRMLVPLLLLLAGPTQPGSPPLPDLLTRAQQRLEASDRAGARRELTEALRLYPASAAVHNFLGVLEAQEGNYRAAEARFREAIDRRLQYTDAYLNLGRLYQENAGKDEQAVRKALAAYEAVLQYQPDHAEARYQIAVLLRVLGEFGRSLEHLARVAHKERDYRGALGYLAHARDLKAGDARIHFFFGMVCVDLDLGVEAYNSLKEAVRLEPDNPAFNYALGAVSL